MKDSILRRTDDYTENTKTYYRLPNSTTMEYLMSHLNHSEGAVLKKGERVLIADVSWKGFVAGVYEMTETPEETGYGYLECRLDLIAMSEELFEDSGTAIECSYIQRLSFKRRQHGCRYCMGRNASEHHSLR